MLQEPVKIEDRQKETFTRTGKAEGVNGDRASIGRLDRREFRSPGAEARIMPFWFWNTRMEPGLIHRQVAEMADAGVGGFFLHPRQGLEIPYLSAEWFGLVKVAVEAAKRLGLHVWLYDEYPYPSGMAGGLLTVNHPEFRSRALDHVTLKADGGIPCSREFAMARVVSAVACPLENGRVRWDRAADVRQFFGVKLTRQIFWRWKLDHCPYNDKRFMAGDGRLVFQWTPPPGGTWQVYLGLEREQRGFKYYDCYFDPLCAGASEAFLGLTHARYAEAVGEHFGATIKGIFTDETEPPEWSPEIESELARAFDLDLSLLLPALREDTHPRASEVRYRFRQCSLRLFQERWEAPVANWCREWGLIWAAEKPTQRPAQFLTFGEPSTDAGHRRVGDAPEPLSIELRSNSRAAMAAAEQAGNGTVRCECFHSMGWGATLQDQKWQLDWLAIQGANRFTPHAFFASIGGLRKHDAAPSFFKETPAWKHYQSLADYTSRLCLALGQGREAVRIAVLYPTESLWIGGPHAAGVRREYEWLMNRLLAEHRMFHPVDSQALRKAQVGDSNLRLGHACYHMLLVPSLTVADRDTAEAISLALEAGLPVLMAAPLADENVDGTLVANLAGQADVVRIEAREQWLEEIERHLPRDLSVALENGQEAEDVWAVWRQAGSQQILFLANTSDESRRIGVEISAPNRTSWREWLLETGDVTACFQDARGRLSLELPPYGSSLLIGEKLPTAEIVPGPDRKTPSVFVLPTDGLWEIHVDRPNTLRLNRWTVVGSAENAANTREIEALPLRFFDKGAEQWQQTFLPDPDGTARYQRTVFCRFVPSDLYLLIEEDAIPGEWSLEINGQPVALERFHPMDFHGSGKTACPVSLYFRDGENRIVLRVEDVPATGGLCSPIHLIGSFALTGPDRRELDRLSAQAAFGDLVGAGFPHFSGTAAYRRKTSLPAMRAGDMLELPPHFEDIAELTVDGCPLGARAWSPYRWEIPRDIKGGVEVEIRVTNTLLPFLEGQFWDSVSRQFQEV